MKILLLGICCSLILHIVYWINRRTPPEEHKNYYFDQCPNTQDINNPFNSFKGNTCTVRRKSKEKGSLTKEKPQKRKQIQKQTVYLRSEHFNSSCQRSTVFFFNPITKNRDYILSLNLTKHTFTSPEEFVTFNCKSPHKLVADVFRYNKIKKVKNITEANVIWQNSCLNENMSNNTIGEVLNKHQKDIPVPRQYWIKSKAEYSELYTEGKTRFPDDINFMPESYVLPASRAEFIKGVGEDYKPKEDDLWLYKPSFNSFGHGIKFIENVNKLPQESGVLSKYGNNAHLINNKRYTIRTFVLVTGFNPVKIYLHQEGIIRFSPKNYKINLKYINQQLSSHLSNFELIKNEKISTSDIDKEEGLFWSLAVYRHYLERQGVNATKLWKDIKELSVKSIGCAVDYIADDGDKLNGEHMNNIMGGYGADIIIDNDMKPWLGEYNSKPSGSGFSQVDKKIKTLISVDLLNLVGIEPYSHKTGKGLTEECKYKDKVEQVVMESGDEFSRNAGGYEGGFPLKENVDYYRKFLKRRIENEEGWKRIKQ